MTNVSERVSAEAREILMMEAFQQAIDEMRGDAFNQFEGSTAEDDRARKEAWYALDAAYKLQRILSTYANEHAT